jgi:hypothetical protein
MNNIHAEVDEIFRTGNKKAVVSLFLSMQGNHIRAVEAETRLTKAQAGIERKDKLIEQMRAIIIDYRIEHKAYCGHDPCNAKKCTCGLSEQIKTALAAERINK